MNALVYLEWRCSWWTTPTTSQAYNSPPTRSAYQTFTHTSALFFHLANPNKPPPASNAAPANAANAIYSLSTSSPATGGQNRPVKLTLANVKPTAVPLNSGVSAVSSVAQASCKLKIAPEVNAYAIVQTTIPAELVAVVQQDVTIAEKVAARVSI
ncbi:hypothetical protein BST61_g3715 [Cercospora zeina]